MEQEQGHTRRVRYKGTHPHTFQEKYKELNPEQYKEDVEKIIQQGKTPAGMHIPICVNEILEFLQIKPQQIGLDATLGYGGHTQKMLECLQGKGHLYSIDVDPIELEKTKTRLNALGYDENILTIKRMNFANIDEVEPSKKFDFVLADLGVSSMQIDNPERGFTFKRDGKLDLRLDPTTGVTAAERLRELNYNELVGMLVENADEPYAEQIAKAIMRIFNKGGAIETTRQLYSAIEDALSFLPAKERGDTIKKSCQRTFQALRIDVNSEFEVLYKFLEKLPNILNSGGRVAILTFHSGEDRLVKKAFKMYCADGVYSDVARDVIRPTAEECNQNPRAHSTKMRWAIKS
ncbi:MAG: 16S rRNA (cytosine(1402)-N(4))-methyltransferase RsmH [Clostridia bacterium]